MDEGKWTFKNFVKLFVIAGSTFAVASFLYGSVVYFQTQDLVNPKECFRTKMYKVMLCPSAPGYVQYKEVPKHFYHSLILSEDASFYSHQGFDWLEIKESFRRNFVEWRFARGGSTLTQQLAKNLYLTSEKSLTRKFKEFFIAKQIEKKMTKAQILEKYVNVVEFGKNTYGLNPAAEHYFNKSPSLLNVLESVYLVSLLPNPRRLGESLKEKRLSEQNKWRMLIILKRLYRTQKINDEIYVYLKMLIDTEAWPFDHYSDSFFEEKGLSIEEQMLLEFDETPEDTNFLENSSKAESSSYELNEELSEPPQFETEETGSEPDEIETSPEVEGDQGLQQKSTSEPIENDISEETEPVVGESEEQ